MALIYLISLLFVVFCPGTPSLCSELAKFNETDLPNREPWSLFPDSVETINALLQQLSNSSRPPVNKSAPFSESGRQAISDLLSCTSRIPKNWINSLETLTEVWSCDGFLPLATQIKDKYSLTQNSTQKKILKTTSEWVSFEWRKLLSMPRNA